MHSNQPLRPASPFRTRRANAIGLLILLPAVAAAGCTSSSGASTQAPSASSSAAPSPRPHVSVIDTPVAAEVWPPRGQAAFIEAGESRIQAGPNQHAAPIASVAKVMTAYVVLRDHPLQAGETGPTITFTSADVADSYWRRRTDQSYVPVAAGEQLTELQALLALMLPSANNIASKLAQWDAGSNAAFVDRMNDTARELGMSHTWYTDPSGWDATTVSTAVDQVRLVLRAMQIPAFASVVATRTANLPVAGTVHNTDHLLGTGGFVGVKTGSMSAAGGCFAFRAIRSIRGRRATITGVVLGQPGGDLLASGLSAAAAMLDRITALPHNEPDRTSAAAGRADGPAAPPVEALARSRQRRRAPAPRPGSGPLPH